MPKNVDHVQKEDTIRNYEGSFFTYEGELVYSYVPENGVVGLRIVSPITGEIQGRAKVRLDFKENPEFQAKLVTPKPKFVFVDNRWLYYIYRRANRQYLFGMSRGNTNIRSFKVFGNKLNTADNSIGDYLQDIRYLKALAKTENNQFDPRKDIQVLSDRCAIYFSRILYDGVEVGSVVKGVTKLIPEFDDSLLFFDLRKLGVPV